ncbi:MAG: NADH-quinone oxidoreductase subunit K [Pseudomonadales bacterium]
MTALLPLALTGVGLFCLGLHALLTHPHLLRKILAVNVMGSGVFLILVSLAKRSDSPVPDPVPQALVITGIVVAVAATALALNLMLGLAASSGKAELAEDLDE